MPPLRVSKKAPKQPLALKPKAFEKEGSYFVKYLKAREDDGLRLTDLGHPHIPP